MGHCIEIGDVRELRTIMTENNPGELYDESYFKHGCGIPYQRDDHWLTFWGKIAERIINDIQPSSVMDAGCAMGFLVEKLREGGVEAYGFDVSEYAISQVHETVQEYCGVGSVSEPFDRNYDLITCVEVLEHISQEEAEKAVENFCSSSDRILFSSTPMDYKEATHFNVQPPEVWSELFARHGFYRDVDFDASFLTPWAVLYVKQDMPVHRTVRSYERKFWLLWKENTDLRELVGELRHNVEIAERLKVENEDLRKKVFNLEKNIQGLNQELRAIHGSRSWKLLQRIRGIGNRFRKQS